MPRTTPTAASACIGNSKRNGKGKINKMIKIKKGSFLLLIAVITFLIYFINRDIKIESQYTGDLRNRVVGARLQMDGKLPYFFKWKSLADNRYLDYQNYDSNQVSNITASPFFHQLLYPIANLSQRAISKIWLFFEYLFILGMAGIAFFYIAKNKNQKTAIIFSLFLLLSSIGWQWQVASGQYYIFISFMAGLFYFFVLKSKEGFPNAPIGILAACMLLLRPNLVFFLLPFLLILNRYNNKSKIIIFGSFIIFLLLYFSLSANRKVWEEYNKALSEQVKLHQDLGNTKQKNAILPKYNLFEGWDFEKAEQALPYAPSPANNENGNVFVLVKSKFKYKIPMELLVILPLFISSFMCIIFWYKCIRKKKDAPSISNIAIFSFCVYMIFDLWSPIYRSGLYYFCQWAFPVILVAAGYNNKYWKAYSFILIGLILNIVEIRFLRSEHSIGEYILLFGLFFYTFIINNVAKTSDKLDIDYGIVNKISDRK